MSAGVWIPHRLQLQSQHHTNRDVEFEIYKNIFTVPEICGNFHPNGGRLTLIFDDFQKKVKLFMLILKAVADLGIVGNCPRRSHKKKKNPAKGKKN